MTISSTVTKVSPSGNGSTTTFSVPFMFTDNADLEVVLVNEDGQETMLTLNTDYTLEDEGNPNGGQCTLAIAPKTGEKLIIRRNPAIVQETDYIENAPFPAASHEAALDKLTMICQTLAERLDRSVTFRVSSAITGIEMPEPDNGRLLGWSDSGESLINRDVADFDAVSLPLSVAQGGTGAGTGNEGLSNLGASAVGLGVITCADTTAGLAALDAEPADTAILRADLPDVIETVFSDNYQTLTGNSLNEFSPERNKIEWVLNETSTFDEIMTDPVSLMFYITPNGNALSFASTYTMYGEEFDSSAPEVRVNVDIGPSVKRVTIVNARGV